MQVARAIQESPWPLVLKSRLDLKIIELTASLQATEIKTIAANMEKVKEMADNSLKNGHRQNACLVWNPRKNEVVALAGDRTDGDDRSLDHAAMCCLKLCAERQISEDAQLGKRDPSEVNEDYLCSGLHIYSLTEPCRLL
jgi:tRNA(Arg) A34 adenosine deaminase TadA